MPYRPRYFAPGQVQFITASTYRRTPLFEAPGLCRVFVSALDEVRREFGFQLLGWVLMPDHFHLLIRPPTAHSTSRIVQQLKQRTAFRILRLLHRNTHHPRTRPWLARLRLPGTVHSRAEYRVWQRRFYPFNIFTEKKRLEKLSYMHNNPVTRRLVATPGDWPWSSWRFYHLAHDSLLPMDRLEDALSPTIPSTETPPSQT